MIDPAGIPVIDGNMDALAGHAAAISDTGRAFADTGAAIHNTWQGLYPHYIAPESGQLLSATGIIATTTASVGEDLGTAGTALTAYADEVRVIQAALVALKSQAEGLAAERTAAGDDWASDPGLVERDTALIDAVNAQVAAFADAERRCANALRVLYGAPLLSVDNGDGVLDPATEHGFTAEQLDAAARNGGTPWGATSDVDHPWPVDILRNAGSFLTGLVVDAGGGAVVGIGTLLGFSGGENAGAAWGALGTLATGALVYGLVGVKEAERLEHNGTIPWLAPGAMGQSLEDAGKAFIAYDQWDDDPSRAAGATVGNVILTVIGPKAVGGATRGAGAAVGRIPGPAAARTSQALINAGTTIGRTPTLTDISRYARNTFPGFRTPDLRTPPINATPDAPARPPGNTAAPTTAAEGRPPGSPGDTGTLSASLEPRPDLNSRPPEPATTSAVDPPTAGAATNTPEADRSAGGPPERKPALVGAAPISASDSSSPEVVPSSTHLNGSDDIAIQASRPSELSTSVAPVFNNADGPGQTPASSNPPANPGSGGAGNAAASDINSSGAPHVPASHPAGEVSGGIVSSGSPSGFGDTDSVDPATGPVAGNATNGGEYAGGEPLPGGTGAAPDPHHFVDDAAVVEYGRQTWNDHVDQLSDAERNAVFDYTVEPPHHAPTYKEINGYLRGLRPATPEVLEHVRNMDAALNARPTPEALVVTRGTNLGHIEVPPGDMKGLVFSDDAYLSTSLGDSPVASFANLDAVLHLHVPEGTPALWVEKVSDFGGSERELLLGRGLSYHVDDVVRRDGQWHITGSIVSDG